MNITNGSAGYQSPTHKTQGLSRTEYRSLFTESEENKIDKARSLIESDLSWIPNFEEQYRDALRTLFTAYNDTPADDGFNMNSKKLIKAVGLLEFLGLLDDENRKNTILLGLPI